MGVCTVRTDGGCADRQGGTGGTVCSIGHPAGKAAARYDWTLPYIKGQSRARSLGNVQAVEQAVQVGAPFGFGDTAQSPYYHYWRDHAEHAVWFEDARSIRAKLMLAGEYRLHGISVWNIMRYFPQLWLVLNTQYEIVKRG